MFQAKLKLQNDMICLTVFHEHSQLKIDIWTARNFTLQPNISNHNLPKSPFHQLSLAKCRFGVMLA